MNNTTNLVKMGIHQFVPYSQNIPGMGQPPSINKKEEKQRLATARLMERAIKNGELSATYAEPVKEMKGKAAERLNKASFEASQSQLAQAGKIATIAKFFIPDAAPALANLTLAAKVATIYAEIGTMSTTDLAVNVAKVALPLIGSASTPLWMPMVAPLLTAKTAVVGVGALIGSVVAMDAVIYFRRTPTTDA